AQAAGGIGLGVDVHDENVATLLSQARAEVDGGGRLPDATFLAGNRNDSTHSLCRAGADFMPTKLRFAFRTLREEETSSDQRVQQGANVPRETRLGTNWQPSISEPAPLPRPGSLAASPPARLPNRLARNPRRSTRPRASRRARGMPGRHARLV